MAFLFLELEKEELNEVFNLRSIVSPKVLISFFRFLEEQVKGLGWGFSILNL